MRADVAARNAAAATFVIFGLNGLVFASWAARIPAAAAALDITAGEIGLLLLALGLGSVLSLPLAGPIAARIGTANTVRAGGIIAAIAGTGLALALFAGSAPGAAAALFGYGVGVAWWDVAQNIEGADVERRLLRTIMPQFHAAFSLGAFAGAMIGAWLSVLQVPLAVHLLCVAAVVTVVLLAVPKYFLPHLPEQQNNDGDARRGRFAAWREPRTVLIGVVVLGAALTEGAANDWIAQAAVAGLGATEATGAVLFGIFVASMTLLRLAGGRFIDRWGRVAVLRTSMAVALVGLLVFVFAPTVPLAVAGAVLWGAGAALGFPMGMSAAADDRAFAAERVSVVSTLGYVAFLAGPPFLGFLGEHVGIRNALLAVALLMVASLLTAPAAREPELARR
ncbi:inner membrane protein YbjJ [Arthrobacter crystallopoietes BAB-32]|uniref:Inner membrane protein YbjJ n=1 Tax=Arthrobacter crystallopoietes BAB-32 TaxID=1246476 RepID=N1UQP9_9MICC|nr:MFS transporter [Arthrobacter crystallopoietes]EMY32716.1 inner membrane protein YbjJ [Arthrobacter crystallopoietes BAB-32]